MSDVYVYAPDADDFTTLGLVGALTPTSCEFEELENGMSEITLVHPIDDDGRYKSLLPERLLRVEVPVRTTPEIENGQYVTSVQIYTVADTATKGARTVYSKKSGGKKKKVLKKGTTVTVVSAPAEGRWKIKTGKTSGWMSRAGLEDEIQETLPDTAAGIETAAPAWVCRDQLFRIYSAEKTEEQITVQARHITYDLMYNITTYDTNAAVDLATAMNGVLDGCQMPHEFEAYTDLSGTRPGAHYIDVDPITALLDPEEGLAAKYDAEIVRDDYELYLLAEAGLDRGVRIEYAKNLLGVDMTTDYDSIATYILPIGQTQAGKPLYLTDGVGPDNRLVRSPNQTDYAIQRIMVLQCENCTVGTGGVTAAIARARMREQALKQFSEEGVDQPDISVSVDFLRLGDTVEFERYRALENVYLYDTVTVYHPLLDIDIKAKVTRVTWDCLADRMTGIELGTQRALVPTVAPWQISGGISGQLISLGTITQWQLADGSIAVEKMDQDVADDIAAGAAAGETAAAAQETAEQAQEAATEAQQLAYQAQAGVDAVIEQTPEGIYISDRSQTATTRALVAPDGFRVLDPDGTVSASLGPRVQTLGTLIIRQTSDGGHAFYNTAQA